MERDKSRTDEKSDRIEDVTQHELQREMVDAEPATDPGEKAVDCGDKGQNGEHIAENLASDNETEQGAFGESM